MSTYPKPKFKRRVLKAKNNPKPTIDDICQECLNKGIITPYASTHEVYEGTGRRQISIRYHMQIKVCDTCHKAIMGNPLHGRDLELKQEFQQKFEKTHTRVEFRRLFISSYL